MSIRLHAGNVLLRSFAAMVFFLLALQDSDLSAQRLCAVLVADTDDEDGENFRAGAANLKDALWNGLPEGTSRTIDVSGANCNAENIKRILSQLSESIAPQDSILFFYAGHGAFDPTRGHYLALNNGPPLFRSEIERAITGVRVPRFWGIITDTCSVIVPVTGWGGAVTAGGGNLDDKALLTHLFLRTTGRIDFNSCRPEQVSMGSSRGGMFTSSLCGIFRDNKYMRLNWDNVFWQARSEASQEFERQFPSYPQSIRYSHRGIVQKTQTAYSFKTMYGNDPNGFRLGIRHTNLRIDSVVPNSPAANLGLSPGMKVVAVNGITVSDDEHLMTAVNFSGKRATLTVRSNGANYNVTVNLGY